MSGKQRKPAANQPGRAENEEKKKLEIIQRLINLLKNYIRFPWKERNEFRYNFDVNHKQFVFEYKDGKYRSVGITHDDSFKGVSNMPLSQNPQKGKTDPAYIRSGIVSGTRRNYGKRTINNLQFSVADKANVKSKIRNYKKRRKKGR